VFTEAREVTMEDKQPLLEPDPMASTDSAETSAMERQWYPPQQVQMPYYPPQQPGCCSQMNQQMTMTASQPASYPARPMTVIVRSSAETADRAIILSVINMLFCCFLFGIIALIFAIRVRILPTSLSVLKFKLMRNLFINSGMPRAKISFRLGLKKKV
jgi:hypothetical protein